MLAELAYRKAYRAGDVEAGRGWRRGAHRVPLQHREAGLVKRSHRPRHRGVVVETVGTRGRVEIVDMQCQLVDRGGGQLDAGRRDAATSARQFLPEVFVREDGLEDDMTSSYAGLTPAT